MPIVLCQVFPSAATKKRPADQIKARQRALPRRDVKNDPQVTHVETWTLFADATATRKPAEFPDLLHPNKAGYAKWAAALRPVLATLGFLETDGRPVHARARLREPLQRPRPHRLGLSADDARRTRRARKRWQASDPNAAAWPFVTRPARFDGLTATPDGRFAAIDGRLVVTTPPEYRKIQQLWTTREFPKDFVLKLEFRATPNADSGVYVRGPQLQCRDYLLAGPYKKLKSYKPQDWNEIVVTVKGGVARAPATARCSRRRSRCPPPAPSASKATAARWNTAASGSDGWPPDARTVEWTVDGRRLDGRRDKRCYHPTMTRLLSFCVVASMSVATVAAQGQSPAAGAATVLGRAEGRRSAPAFSLPGSDGKTHSLSDYKGKTVVLAWFPKAFTGG